MSESHSSSPKHSVSEDSDEISTTPPKVLEIINNEEKNNTTEVFEIAVEEITVEINMIKAILQGKINADEISLNDDDTDDIEDKILPPPLPNEAKRTCYICCENIFESRMFKLLLCEHNSYCRKCIRRFINTEIMDGKCQSIKCPFLDCEETICYSDIKSLLSDSDFKKFENFSFKAAVNMDPTMKSCPHCDYVFFAIEQDGIKACEVGCPNCTKGFCCACMSEWHQGVSCEKFKKSSSKKSEKGFSKWAKKNSKKCPKCNSHIEKISGCNHMTCAQCHYQFCWLCGGKYTSNHYDIYNVLGCPGQQHYTKNNGIITRSSLRIFLASSLVVCVPIGAVAALGLGIGLGIPFAIVILPIVGGIKIYKRAQKRRKRERRIVI